MGRGRGWREEKGRGRGKEGKRERIGQRDEIKWERDARRRVGVRRERKGERERVRKKREKIIASSPCSFFEV